MTQYLPGNLLALFTARPAIPFKPPVDRLKKRKNSVPYSPVTSFMTQFETVPPPPATRGETREEQAERKKIEKKAAADDVLSEKLLKWDPHSDKNATGDPFKTLFVARINYDTTESKLRRELESYGPIRQINMIYNVKTRKPRGYALVEYEHERDMHSAYKHADGKKIDGRRILVDVERGRTVKSWRPRRLGGGLGGTRRGGPDENIRHSGRVEQWESTGGGGREREREKEPREDKPRKRSRSPRERERRDRDRGDRDRDVERSERRRDRDRSERGGERPERVDRENRPEDGERGEDRERGEIEEADPPAERAEKEERRAARERGGDDDDERERRERRRRERRERDRERERGERKRERGERGEGEREPGERERERGEKDRSVEERGGSEGGGDAEQPPRDREQRERERERERYRQSRDEGELPPDDETMDTEERNSSSRNEMSRYGGGDARSNGETEHYERGEIKDRMDESNTIEDERLRFDAKEKMQYATAVFD